MDYQESNVSGSSYVRCQQINIFNPLGGPGRTLFVEERITKLGDRQLVDRPYSPMSLPYQPDMEIDLYDPNTLEKTGKTITQAEIYTILFSAYMTMARARDLKASGESQTGTVTPVP